MNNYTLRDQIVYETYLKEGKEYYIAMIFNQMSID